MSRFRPRTLALIAGLGTLALPACDLADPTRITNPNLTEQAVLETDQPLRFWVQGLERQLAVAFANYTTEAEIASDNYQNTNTFFDQELDLLNLIYTNQNTDATFFVFSDLRESARYGREVVAEVDEDATDADLAETYFFEAVADVVLGQAFTAAPLEPEGPLAAPEDHLRAALTALDEALRLQPDAGRRAGYRLLQARAHYALGNRAEAAQAAQVALSDGPTYVRFVRYDEVGGVDNDIESAIFDRASFDDLQPLPRLDFLDPKFALTGGEDAPLPLLKAEEAALILAEAALADGQLDQAKVRMMEALDIVATRPVGVVDDNAEDRTQRAPGSRPNTADFVVRASPDAPFVSGLVLTRKGDGVTVSVPTVSGTSVTDADVDALTSVEDAVRLLYLLRQEVFFAEGRRMLDLGIRFPVPETEIVQNENLGSADIGDGFVPVPLRPFSTQFDAFTVNGDEVTILVDLNRVIAENRTDSTLAPLF